MNGAALARDLHDFSRGWQQGLQALSSIDDADVQIGTTPKREVLARDKVRLYRYEATMAQRVDTPVLIIYSQVGRYTMLDLQDDRSVVRKLLAQGIDVYVIDWGNPNRSDRWLRLDDYVADYIDACVEHICDETGCEAVSLFGICEGGIMAACYAALNPQRVANLVLAVTPIDFHADQASPRLDHGQLNRWARSMPAADVEAFIDGQGALPGLLMGAAFQALTPMQTLRKFTLDLPDTLNADRDDVLNFLRMEKWLSDRPDHPAEAAKQLLINLYQRNELVRGEFELDGRRVDLAQITMPVLNVFATGDHIVPAETARRLRQHVGTSDYTELELKAGHIGTFVSRRAGAEFASTLCTWLHERQAAG